jgi:hypothetical protein
LLPMFTSVRLPGRNLHSLGCREVARAGMIVDGVANACAGPARAAPLDILLHRTLIHKCISRVQYSEIGRGGHFGRARSHDPACPGSKSGRKNMLKSASSRGGSALRHAAGSKKHGAVWSNLGIP